MIMPHGVTVLDSPIRNDEYMIVTPTRAVYVVRMTPAGWEAVSSLHKDANDHWRPYPLSRGFRLNDQVLRALDQYAGIEH
jgi:hypothetical protein